MKIKISSTRACAHADIYIENEVKAVVCIFKVCSIFESTASKTRYVYIIINTIGTTLKTTSTVVAVLRKMTVNKIFAASIHTFSFIPRVRYTWCYGLQHNYYMSHFQSPS